MKTLFKQVHSDMKCAVFRFGSNKMPTVFSLNYLLSENFADSTIVKCFIREAHRDHNLHITQFSVFCSSSFTKDSSFRYTIRGSGSLFHRFLYFPIEPFISNMYVYHIMNLLFLNSVYM
jgi:hypothetical protein